MGGCVCWGRGVLFLSYLKGSADKFSLSEFTKFYDISELSKLSFKTWTDHKASFHVKITPGDSMEG